MRCRHAPLLILGLLLAGQAAAQTPVDEPVRVDPSSITLRPHPVLIWAQVLGEVVNETDFLIGDVRVAITARNAAGRVLDSGIALVEGENVEIDGEIDAHGISPGGRALFTDTFIEIPADSIASLSYAVTFSVASPRTDLTQTSLLLRIDRIDSLSQATRLRLDRVVTRLDSLGGGTTSSLLGDLDIDGDVDFTDFVTFAANFGKTR